MSTILVTGGTGTLGKALVRLLGDQGHEVRVLSRRTGAGTHTGDLSTGAGLVRALEGVELVVHAASDRRLGRTDVEQTRNLLRASQGLVNLLYVSIVGIDRIPIRYYRRKLACEDEIARSGVPYTILRATQFHELLAMLLGALERFPIAPLPGDFRFQTVASAEVAARAAELVTAGPAGMTADFGGPQTMTLGDMARAWQLARGRPRRLVGLHVPGAAGRAFRQGLNTSPGHAEGRQTWEEYLRADAGRPA